MTNTEDIDGQKKALKIKAWGFSEGARNARKT
jgi:hypothetical protein